MRLYFKVPGCLADLLALLTRKLPIFLSRLNEVNGGIIRENFEIFENDIFDVKVLWMVGEGGIMMVSSFCYVWCTVSRSI